jgi:uncharacterized protein YegP (UPF0339 family)
MITINKNTNDYSFVVKTKTGKALLKSISFSNKEDIKNTLQHLCEAPPKAQKIERRTNFEGKFLFDLKNNAGEIIGHSGLYSSEAGMENGIKNFKVSLEGIESPPQL